MNTSTLQVESWPIERLIPYARNARTHSEAQVSQIAASIAEFGFNNPVLADADGGIIAGHGRVLAARQLQHTHVPVIVIAHLNNNQRRAFMLADNKLALNAGWDEDMLRLELEALKDENFDLSLVAFEEAELARLLDHESVLDGLKDEDEAPAVREVPVSVPGDLWALGMHKLLVGDATNVAAVSGLMAGDLADLVFTDPPYNVDYEGYTADRLSIEGDRMTAEQFSQFLNTTFLNYRTIVKPGASLYICHASSWQREFQNALETAGFEIRCQVIWAKNTFAWGFGRYKFQHEPLFYAHIAEERDAWYGNKSQSTLWQENKPAANRLHPTMKPVELIERALLNSSKTGDIVTDLFGGSGSTMIACERRGRKARLMELDPRYADVIIRRWQDYTGNTATLEFDGRCFDGVAEQRLSAESESGKEEEI